MGEVLGDIVGIWDGVLVGDMLGLIVGFGVGSVGLVVGILVGLEVGVGFNVGLFVGDKDGESVGLDVGGTGIQYFLPKILKIGKLLPLYHPIIKQEALVLASIGDISDNSSVKKGKKSSNLVAFELNNIPKVVSVLNVLILITSAKTKLLFINPIPEIPLRARVVSGWHWFSIKTKPVLFNILKQAKSVPFKVVADIMGLYKN